VQLLRLNHDVPWIGQGILLDAWGPATPEVQPGRAEQIIKPLLSIGSETFRHWRENYNKVERTCKEAKQNIALSW
jgi:platelet-activating factor acetylhydrolase